MRIRPDLGSGVCVQVQALLQEVQQLREELRSRDQTIAHLTLQLVSQHLPDNVARPHRPCPPLLIKFHFEQAVPTATTRCHCQQTKGRVDCHTQTSMTEEETATSQTLRRENKVRAHTHTHTHTQRRIMESNDRDVTKQQEQTQTAGDWLKN